jgi:putative ABC transport system permease protein
MKPAIRQFMTRLFPWFRPRWSDADLSEEIHAHLDLLAGDFVRRGMTLDEARAAARREFGGVDQMKERYRDQRGLPFAETLAQDLRYGWRLLCRSPGFTTAAVLILALGIGATSAIFSLVDAALLRPLPYRDPARIVAIWERAPRFARAPVAPLTFLEWSEQSRSFDVMAAATGVGGVMLDAGKGDVDSAPAFSVTPRFFDVFGVVPIAGRFFVDDDSTQQRNAAIVSERLWRGRFGADPGLIGRSLPLAGGQSLTVVGIAPADFRVFAPADVWLLYGPISKTPAQRRNHYLRVVARLKTGVSLEAAQSEMAAMSANIAREAPDTNKDIDATIVALQRSVVGEDLRTTALVLGGLVAFVLLLACANVANLLLARGLTRRREIAVRAALGGGRWRIVRQLLTETLLLAALGGVVGLILAWVAVRLIPTLLPSGAIPEGVELKFDVRLALFASFVTLATALVAGLTPTWRTARVSVSEAMAGGRTTTGHGGALREVLTIIEVATAVLLVIGAGLLVRTLISLDNVDAGYRADRILTMQVAIELPRYPTQESRVALYKALQDEVARVPGVRAAALGFDVPFDGWGGGQLFSVVGTALDEPSRHPPAHYQPVGPGYFEALGIPLLRGRAFTDLDNTTSTPVCIVNEEFARRYLADRDPIGAKVSVQSLALAPTNVTREVVGVVRQVKERPDARDNQIEIYVPVAQNSWYTTTLVVRAAVPPATLVAAIRAAAGRVRKGLPPTRIRTMEDIALESTATPRFRARLVSTFAVLAIVLAARGVFSVFTFTVHQRTREFSVRRALGASGGDILRLVMRQGVVLVILGLAIGLAAAGALVRSLTSLLFAVKPFDPLTFAGAAALLALVALTACALPALRAARSDPAVALRQE